MQGFLTAAALGRLSMGPPVPRFAHLSDNAQSVRADLLALAHEGRAHLISAVGNAVGEQMSTLILPHLRMLLAGVSQQPLNGDSPLFEPLLATASNAKDAAFVSATALLLHEAVASLDDEGWFGITLWSVWSITGWRWTILPAGRSLAGLRHLYEADPEWRPMPEREASPAKMDGMRFLPVLDMSFSSGVHGARVG